MALVDIVVRTRERPLLLRRALEDITAQSMPDWNLIVVNDGGPGLTPDDGTTVVNLPDSVGRAAAVQVGIEAGEAPFIVWHDDDDTWHPDFLARTVEHLTTTDDLAVATRTQIVWERLVGQQYVPTRREIFHPTMQEPTYFDHQRFNHVVPISLLYRREAHDRVGPIDASLLAVSDWDFNMRLLQAGNVGFIDEVLAFWHHRADASGPDSNSVIGERAAHVRFDRRVRDAAVRAQADPSLLYQAKFIDERSHELQTRADTIEAKQQETLRLLAQLRP